MNLFFQGYRISAVAFDSSKKKQHSATAALQKKQHSSQKLKTTQIKNNMRVCAVGQTDQKDASKALRTCVQSVSLW